MSLSDEIPHFAEVLTYLHASGLAPVVEGFPDAIPVIKIDLDVWRARHEVKPKQEIALTRYPFPAVGAAGCGGLREYRGKPKGKEDKECISGEGIADSGAQTRAVGTQ